MRPKHLGPQGLEPRTKWLWVTCSDRLSYGPRNNNGQERIRTSEAQVQQISSVRHYLFGGQSPTICGDCPQVTLRLGLSHYHSLTTVGSRRLVSAPSPFTAKARNGAWLRIALDLINSQGVPWIHLLFHHTFRHDAAFTQSVPFGRLGTCPYETILFNPASN